MDVAIVKTKDGYLAFSLFPVGVVGWSDSEKGAVKDIENNLYDYCNWLLWKLPKDENPVVVEKYNGEIENISFKADDKKLFKKYAEITMQTAFSFKCMVDSVNLTKAEEDLVESVVLPIGITKDKGIIEFASNLIEGEDFKSARLFIYKVYRLAKELFFAAKNRGESIFDSFKFDV